MGAGVLGVIVAYFCASEGGDGYIAVLGKAW
jgi:hypothetical protein